MRFLKGVDPDWENFLSQLEATEALEKVKGETP
jgi:hypothetical protein